MLTRRFLIAGALSTVLAGCASMREPVIEERDPIEAERQQVEILTTKLNDPASNPAEIQALFEQHAYTLLAHSTAKRDRRALQAIQNLPQGDARVRKLEVSLLDAMSRDPENEKGVWRIKNAFAKAAGPERQTARRAMWRMAAKTVYLYDL